jgi:acylphosphatase
MYPEESMATHDITLVGTVQHVGLRTQIEGLGRGQERRGIVYNEDDDRVQILTNGEDIEEFIEGIESAVETTRAEITDIDVTTLEEDLHLPAFSRVRSDDLGDVSDKLDEGNTILDEIRASTASIERNTDTLVEKQTELLEAISDLS